MNPKIILLLLLIVAVVVISGCTSNQGNNTTKTMTLASSAFSDEGAIPIKYTGNGEDVSPPLNWSSAPTGTKTFAIICQDLDSPGGDFTHWIIFNMPSNSTQLSEAVPKLGNLENGAKQGTNDFNQIGYGGPNPPSGTHRYIFTIYALDSALNLNPGAHKNDFLNAIKGHILAEGKLTGIYSK